VDKPQETTASGSPAKPFQRITPIEGLRAYLAFWVVFDHILGNAGYKSSLFNGFSFTKILCSGWYAVDVFVIISGFVIFYLLDNKVESYKSFLTRRFFRLWPLFVLLFLVSIPVSRLSLVNLDLFAAAFPDSPIAGKGGEWIESWWEHVVAHILVHLPMLHGLVPDKLLPLAPVSFLGPAWSISLEWQFYIIAPFLFLYIRSGNKWRISLLTLGCLMVMLVAPKFEYPRFGEFNKVGAFLPMHIEFFYIGCLSYFLFKHFHKSPLAFPCFPLGIFLGSIVGITCSFLLPLNWDWIPYVIWLVFFTMILDLQMHKVSPITLSLSKVFDNPLSLYLGKISYSIYLVHVLVIATCQWGIFSFFPHLSQPQHLWVLGLTSFLSTILFSHILYKRVEKPGMQLGFKLAFKWEKRGQSKKS
jgi:peptidoglycan/LPS O-acetylase OafA/YrhL